MTANEVRTLAQQSPIRSLSSRLGELKEQADREILNLTSTLRQLDGTRDLLDQHGLAMTVDLGPVGNAAANERRKQATPDARTFSLPKAS